MPSLLDVLRLGAALPKSVWDVTLSHFLAGGGFDSDVQGKSPKELRDWAISKGASPEEADALPSLLNDALGGPRKG